LIVWLARLKQTLSLFTTFCLLSADVKNDGEQVYEEGVVLSFGKVGLALITRMHM